MPDAIQETLVLVKPDGVARNLTGEILRRIEAKGYSITDLKMVEADRDAARAALRGARRQAVLRAARRVHGVRPDRRRPRRGQRVIEGFRSLAGTTDPTTAAPGTIRGDFGRDWGLGCSRTSCTAATARSPPPASSPSGSPEQAGASARWSARPLVEVRAQRASRPPPALPVSEDPASCRTESQRRWRTSRCTWAITAKTT